MSVFTNILKKLGLDKAETEEAPKPQSTPKPSSPDAARESAERRARSYQQPAKSKSTEIPVVDVVAQLEERAAARPEKLNWKESIVDLLKLLDLDSSYEARKELAVELECPADKMDDSARMNTWLHKTVLQKIAENGGNIPKELLD